MKIVSGPNTWGCEWSRRYVEAQAGQEEEGQEP